MGQDLRYNDFKKSIVDEVWEKGKKIDKVNPNIARRDVCGAFIYKEEYGKNTDYGWEIDHIKPVSKSGTDHLDNLQPFHWENNHHKGDNFPAWDCKKNV